jgi:stearoyl-CoA desaturase (delta-9 desaturase)
MTAETQSLIAVSKGVPSPRKGVDWTIAGPLLLVHLLCLLAPFTFTWEGLFAFLLMYLVTGFGVTAGAHRFYTHASFEASALVRWMLSLSFHLAGQGSLSRWVRDHHIHHSYSDREGDPHSPHHSGGFWFAQLTWLWQKPVSAEENKALYQRFAKGLKQDAAVRVFSQGAALTALHLGFIALAYTAGALWQEGLQMQSLWLGWHTGISVVIWGVFLRIAAVLHSTSLVNSASHLWGYRNYETREESRNNAWVAFVSLGEGWHNNHHGRPSAANQGFHNWWEFDLTFCFLLLLGSLGLIRQVRVFRAKTQSTEVWFNRKSDAKPSN